MTTPPRAKTATGPEASGGSRFAAFREVPRTGVIFVTTEAQTKAIHQAFGKKRARLLNGLRDLGFTVDQPPEGTFYVWASTAT